jgi:hypothetical protein
MTMRKRTWATLALLSFVPAARAQEPAARPQEPAEAREPRRAVTVTPLKVQLVFSKYQGEKKVASLPYALTCNANDRGPAILRMGIEVPVPMAPVKDSALMQIQYKNVGTNIDCRAMTVDDGRFRLELNVEQSSIYSAVEEKQRRPGPAGSDAAPLWGVTEVAGGSPMFRSFRSTFAPVLRDGQTVQYTAATDPVSGEVVKIDVTLTVLK